MSLIWRIALHCYFLAFNACHAFYNDAKPVISTVDRSHASSRSTKHVGRGLKSPAAAICDPLLRIYANRQQMSRKIAAGLFMEHSLLPADSKAQHESIELCTICGGLEGALGKVDMLCKDIGARELAALGAVKSNEVSAKIGGLMARKGSWRERLYFPISSFGNGSLAFALILGSISGTFCISSCSKWL